MKYFLATASALTIMASAASAAPTVSGNTITWPDDGWYQVQLVNDDGIIEVCQGGLSCEVLAGEYIVINLSTGERFEDIMVSGSSNTAIVSVSGNVISWPDNGWYQVQDSLTYSSVCNGTRSCAVEPGNYVVINHTSGERFEDIRIEENAEPIRNDGITVDGNLVSWPDNGWYQVQNSMTYASLCEGGMSCSVPAGEYIVINHTSGQRFENVLVTDVGPGPQAGPQPEPAPQTAPQSAIVTSDVATVKANLFTVLGGSAQNAIAQYFALAFARGEPEFSVTVGDYLVTEVERLDSGMPVRATFACTGGGNFEKPGFQRQGQNQYSEYNWDNCTIDAFTYSGTISKSGGVVQMNNFSVSTEGSVILEATGNFGFSGTRSGNISITSWAFEQYRDTASGLTLTDSSVIDELTFPVEGPRYTLDIDVNITAPWTNDFVLRATTGDVPLEQVSAGSQPYETGSVTISYPDTRIVLDANSGDPQSYLQTVMSNGSVSSDIFSWSDLRANCIDKEPLLDVSFSYRLCR